jgi:N-acetylneuraminic acid mutarotase
VSRRGLIYCIGGRQQTVASTLGTVEAFDPLERRWITGYANMPTARAGHAAGLLHGKIVVLGGEGPGVTYSEVEEYDPRSNTWRALTSMSSPRHGTNAAVIGNILYVPGGGLLPGSDATDTMLAFTFLP